MPKKSTKKQIKQKYLLAFLSLLLIVQLLYSLAVNRFNTALSKDYYTVVSITDGDTIVVQNNGKNTTLRLLSVDTPESNLNQCFANEAKQFLQTNLLNKSVQLQYDTNKVDRFGRQLAYVFYTPSNIGGVTPSNNNKVFLNDQLLRLGLARYFYNESNTKYQNQLMQSAKTAQNQGVGLWGSCGEDKYNNKCLIKGNIDKNGKKYYHLPGDKHYSQVQVNLNKYDQWFCTTSEAKQNGFTHASQCSNGVCN